ncbi:unnamed protein product [Parajaminaea phylloscopi]
MAKSLRSKSKLGSRNVKRYNEKSDYAVVHAARLHATASRLAEKNKNGKTVTEEDADEEDVANGDAKMDAVGQSQEPATAAGGADNDEAQPAQKISTSGTRESRRETWRKAKGWKPKQGSKNGGRPKRRK